MSAKILINNILLTGTPSGAQLVTVKYRLYPNGSFQTYTSSLSVPASGILTTDYEIVSLVEDTDYEVQLSLTNSPTEKYAKQIRTAKTVVGCPTVVAITGVSSNE